MQIDGVITTTHRNPSCVAAAIRVDNLSEMRTETAGGAVRTTIAGTKLRSVIASVDDYLMNLAIAEETCRYINNGGRNHTAQGRTKGQTGKTLLR